LIEFTSLEHREASDVKSHKAALSDAVSIVAGPDAVQLIDHEFPLATLDLNSSDRSRQNVRPDDLNHAVADADRSSKIFVDPLQSCRNIHPVPHDRIAELFVRADIVTGTPP